MRKRSWTDEQLFTAVQKSKSYRQVLRHLGLREAGGNYVHIGRYIAEKKLDVSHFTGQGWNVGMQFRPRSEIPLDQVMVEGSIYQTHLLKPRLFKANLKKPECEICGWAQYSANGRLPLELDHINGEPTDNRLENLRILCPNCHSLQPTHRGMNKKRKLRRGGGIGQTLNT